MKLVQTSVKTHTQVIRTMVRSAYDLQRLRIQVGNRVAGNFRAKIGMTSDGMSEEELEAESKNILERLRKSYTRITDAIVAETGKSEITRLQMSKRFKSDDLITEVAELFLMDNYLMFLKNEEQHFKDMEKILDKIPIYTEFLKGVAGVGPAMAAVLISEIDIHKAEYPSSLIAFAGLDVVTVFRFDVDGETIRLSAAQAADHKHVEVHDGVPYYKGIEGVMEGIGRNRQSYSLVTREYENAKGETAFRQSITFSPFLKTKLIGVLAGSFLKVGSTKVNGENMTAGKRLKYAQDLGFDLDDVRDDQDIGKEVIKFLQSKGIEVIKEQSEYARMYYDYKTRLEHNPKHQGKTPAHRHAMALRYIIKQFLIELYKHYRALEGLVVAPPYAEAKLNLVHGKAVENKGARRA